MHSGTCSPVIILFKGEEHGVVIRSIPFLVGLNVDETCFDFI